MLSGAVMLPMPEGCTGRLSSPCPVSVATKPADYASRTAVVCLGARAQLCWHPIRWGAVFRRFPARQAADSATTADARIVVLEAAVDWATRPDRSPDVLVSGASARATGTTFGRTPCTCNPTTSRQKRKTPMTNSNFTVAA